MDGKGWDKLGKVGHGGLGASARIQSSFKANTNVKCFI